MPFILVGDLAVNAHRYGRYTGGVGLVVRLQPDVINKAFAARSMLGYEPTEPFDFDREYAQALVEEAASGAEVRIIRLAALARLKREAGRPQDLADLMNCASSMETSAMPDEIDWALTTWSGNRRRQHLEFQRLTFSEKLDAIE